MHICGENILTSQAREVTNILLANVFNEATHAEPNSHMTHTTEKLINERSTDHIILSDLSSY